MNCSLFLYYISVPDKEGYPTVDIALNEDVKLDKRIDTEFFTKQLSVESVIVKSFVHYQRDVIITDRIRALFSSKLWRIAKAMVAQK